MNSFTLTAVGTLARNIGLAIAYSRHMTSST